MTLVRSIRDLDGDQIDWILARAGEHRAGLVAKPTGHGSVVGLAFLEPSLRTRIGYAAAAARLGAQSVEVSDLRAGSESKPESVADTVRTLAGYCDVIVARVPVELSLPPGVAVPVLNGGDRGPAGEHPSQALIDLFAMQSLGIPIHDQSIVLCGDLRMRAARSLLLVLADHRPRSLTLVTEPELTDGFSLPAELESLAQFSTLADAHHGADALYIVGLPYGVIDEAGRTRLRVTTAHLDGLSSSGAAFSPMPIIDEAERNVLLHPRARMFAQSDDGLFVRMAMLELLLGDGPAG